MYFNEKKKHLQLLLAKKIVNVQVIALYILNSILKEEVLSDSVPEESIKELCTNVVL